MSVKPWIRRCAVCGQPFEVDHPMTVTCGPACSREKRRLRDRERYAAIHHKENKAEAKS
jgi:predicted nucleic acid-binding Zn ribbon protein